MPETLEARHLRLLGLVALALLFEQYDLSLSTSALPYIAADLGMREAELGDYLTYLRLGSVSSLLVVPLADGLGRRRVFLACILGSGVGTLATAFVGTPWEFVLVQMGTRAFLTGGQALAFVIVTEEFPAEHRGWGIGMLGALGAMGVGLGAALFAAVEILPGGWRALYVVGVVPLFLLGPMRRGIAETRRYEIYAAARSASGETAGAIVGWFRAIGALARRHPGRATLIALVAGLDALGKVAVFQFTSYHVKTAHGWDPWQYSVLVLVAGVIGITGNVVAGRLGDRFGRRAVGFAVMALFPLSGWAFYQGPVWGIPPAWTAFAFLATAGTVIQRALATELFPTSHRSTAIGWMTLVESLAAAAGLKLVGIGSAQQGDYAWMTSLLSSVVLLGGLLLLLFPETSRRELESISEPPEAPPR